MSVDRADHRGTIGAVVGVATAGVIALLLVTDDREPEHVQPLRSFVVPEIPKTLPGPPRPKLFGEPTAVKDETKPEVVPDETDPKFVSAQTRALFDRGALSKEGRLASMISTNSVERFEGRTITTRTVIAEPRISIADLVVTLAPTATVIPGIARARVRRDVQAAVSLERCFTEKQAAGTVNVRFVVRGTGRVTATSNGVDPDVATCVAKTIEKIEMPQATDIDVTMSITYKPG